MTSQIATYLFPTERALKIPIDNWSEFFASKLLGAALIRCDSSREFEAETAAEAVPRSDGRLVECLHSALRQLATTDEPQAQPCPLLCFDRCQI